MTIKTKFGENTGQRNYKRSFHGSPKIIRCFRAIRFFDLYKSQLNFANANCEQRKFSFFEKKIWTDSVGSF